MVALSISNSTPFLAVLCLCTWSLSTLINDNKNNCSSKLRLTFTGDYFVLNILLSILPILSHLIFVMVIKGGCCHHACCTDKGSPRALGAVVGPQQCAHQGQVDSGALLLTPHYTASWSPWGAGTWQETFARSLPPLFITELFPLWLRGLDTHG